MFHTKVVQKIKRHVLCSMYLQKIVLFEITWKNGANPDRLQMTIRRLRIACSISTATMRHSEYVIPIVLLQQRLHERASMLRCYVHCLSSLQSPNDVTSPQRHFVCIHHYSHYHSECHKSSKVERLITKLDNRELYERLSTDYHFRLQRTILITTTWGNTKRFCVTSGTLIRGTAVITSGAGKNEAHIAYLL
jgi:hypothetical protein